MTDEPTEADDLPDGTPRQLTEAEAVIVPYAAARIRELEADKVTATALLGAALQEVLALEAEVTRLTALGDALAAAAHAITTDPWIDGPNAGPNPKWDALDAALDAWDERDDTP